jgi:hypothetical protein
MVFYLFIMLWLHCKKLKNAPPTLQAAWPVLQRQPQGISPISLKNLAAKQKKILLKALLIRILSFSAAFK